MRFVDQEGRVFIHRFYQRHRKNPPAQMAEDLYARVRGNPRRFTSVFRYLEPEANFETYVGALHKQIPASVALSPKHSNIFTKPMSPMPTTWPTAAM